MQAVRELAVTSVGSAGLTELDLVVASWRPPRRGGSAGPGLAGLTALTIEPRDSGVHLAMTAAAPVDAALLLAAAVRCLQPVPSTPAGAMLTFTAGLPTAAASLAPQIRDVLLEGEARDAHVRRCDLLVVPPPGRPRIRTAPPPSSSRRDAGPATDRPTR